MACAESEKNDLEEIPSKSFLFYGVYTHGVRMPWRVSILEGSRRIHWIHLAA